MEYYFYYISVLITIFLAIVLRVFKKPLLPKIIIGITTVAVSMVFDTLMGSILGLFYYISPHESLIYSILSAIFLYSLLNIMYVSFLPQNIREDIIYTIFWIAGLLLFEYLSVIANTIVYTGWSMFPWSVILYIVSYAWISLFYKYLLRKYKSLFIS